jgi:LacI family transcriptional regulator
VKNIALLIETSNAYARGLLLGIVAYMREHPAWSIHLAEHGRGDRPPHWLADWQGDGILARVETPSIARALRRVTMPVVDMSAARLIPELPWFETDDAAIAQLAYEHLKECGFKRFAYCGDQRFNWSNWRSEHFQRAVRADGAPCFVFEASKKAPADDAGLVDDLVRWLRRLQKPIGVMACYDLRGQQILDACRRARIPVPEQVAVIGVDNDEIVCELSYPPLTSIVPNTRRTGYEAAALLDILMAGHKAPGRTHLIPPSGVAARQSTDVLAVEDAHVAQAVRFIREHACQGINVSDVLKVVPQGRRLLESRFKRFLGRTPHDEIMRVQINRVKELLSETDLPLTEVAERTGFKHVEYLSVVFKKKAGMPPSGYRALHRKTHR